MNKAFNLQAVRSGEHVPHIENLPSNIEAGKWAINSLTFHERLFEEKTLEREPSRKSYSVNITYKNELEYDSDDLFFFNADGEQVRTDGLKVIDGARLVSKPDTYYMMKRELKQAFGTLNEAAKRMGVTSQALRQWMASDRKRILMHLPLLVKATTLNASDWLDLCSDE